MCLLLGTNELVGETDFLGRMKPRVGGDVGGLRSEWRRLQKGIQVLLGEEMNLDP